MVCGKIFSASEFVTHAESIDNCHYAVELRSAVACKRAVCHVGNRTDGLGDRGRLADPACLNDYVVKLLHRHYLLYLLDEIHFQGAADAAVLQGHERIVFCVDDASALNQIGVNIDFTDIIDYDRETYAAAVGEYMVYESGLATSEIAC